MSPDPDLLATAPRLPEAPRVPVEDPRWRTQALAYLAVTHSHPAWLVERWLLGVRLLVHPKRVGHSRLLCTRASCSDSAGPCLSVGPRNRSSSSRSASAT